MRRPEIEILVHIAAPARGVDDVRYRTLAAAYFDFEPACRTRTSVGQAAKDGAETTLPKEREFVGMGIDQGSPSLSKEHGVLESPILSFRSANNNFHSPRLPFIAPASELHVSETQSSWQAPPSEIPDSMPDSQVPFGSLCTPSRKLDFFTSSLESQNLPSSPLVRRRSQRLAPGAQAGTQPSLQPRRSPRRHQDLQDALQSRTPDVSSSPPARQVSLQEPPSQPSSRSVALSNPSLPALPHPGLSAAASKIIPQSPDVSFLQRPNPTQTSSGEVIEETVLYSSDPSQKSIPSTQEPPALVRADSEPVAKRRRTVADLEPGQPLVRSTSDIGPRRQPPALIIPNRPSAYYKSRLTAVSPPPPIAQIELQPSDVISPVLARLATELDLSTRYKPQSQTRELRPFERGYWLVDTTSWPHDLKLSAWVFLTDYLEKGLAGWGTTCSRDPEYSWLKLRCWGCVVGHMHLLLYLASRREVKGTGMKWYGGDGKVVVVMGPR